jgi:ParB family chromosome partitioning protein
MRRGLGKGLEELLAIYDREDKAVDEKHIDNEVPTNTPVKSISSKEGVSKINIEEIYPNPNQPRKTFDRESLEELAESIRVHGLIQPIIVNKMDDGYLIIAGERRYRACKLAGLTEIDAIVKNYTDRQIAEISIIENLQREDLNPIEIAKSLQKLMQEYNITQDQVASRIGKNRSSIANYVRLLSLYPEVIDMVEKGKVSHGHAKCLVAVTDYPTQLMLAKKVAQNKLTVRALEKEIDLILGKGKTKKVANLPSQELLAFISDLQRKLGTKVTLLGNDKKGRIYIDYYSQDDLDRIYDIILK